ncbi:MAG: GUN4 domain-containing protein [Actinomycetota bacterium]
MLKLQPEIIIENLDSERGIDYRLLHDLLTAGNWQEADRETAKKMCEVMGRQAEGWLRVEDIDNFPSVDLRIINQLWLKYSHNRFGFSLQKQLYESLGGSRIYDRKVWRIFGDRVGWRENNQWLNYNQLSFSLDANLAHLPAREAFGMGGRRVLGEVWVVGALLSRPDLGTMDEPVLNLPKVEVKSTSEPLNSERGVDYTRLRDLLAAGNWREADEETRAILLKLCNREREGSLTIEAIKQLPCVDLYTLDQLWTKYSQGRFGISVQKRIWENLGGSVKAGTEIWYPFAKRLGWWVKNSWLPLDDLRFTLDAPEGQLPVVSLRKSLWGYLFARAAACRL